MTTTASPAFPIVEPLSDATREAIEPLKLKSTDYLEIGIEDETNFFMRPYSGREIADADAGRYDASLLRRNSAKKLIVPGYSNPSFDARDFFRRIPESKLSAPDDFTKRDEWKVAATDYSVVMVHCCWPIDRLLFVSDEARTLFEFLLRRFLAQNVRAEMQARFKLTAEAPEDPKDYRDAEGLPLSPYQKVGMLMGLGQEAIGLLMDKGTGKTPLSIARICTEARRTRAGKMGPARMMRVLIVCPNQVRHNWQKEFNRFATAPGKVTVMRGGKLLRLRLFTHAITTEDDCAFSAVIVGYDTITSDENFFAACEWDLVILDESHYIKSAKTNRWSSLKLVRDNSLRRMILTGTPIGNTVFDLFTQFEFLGEGLSGFTSFKAFKSWHGKFVDGVKDASGVSVEKCVGVANVPLLKERLARLTFSITKEEAGLNLPPKVHDSWEVEMTATQKEYYRKLAKQLALEIEEVLENSTMSKEMTAEHILTQLLRLNQITSGHCKWNPVVDPDSGETIRPGYVEQIPGGNPKVDALLEMLADPERDAKREKFVVWCTYKEDIRVVHEALKAAGYKGGTYYGATSQNDRDAFETAFNSDPTFMYLVCHAATAGEGLNLVGYDYWNATPTTDTYCGLAVYFSVNWSFIQRSQSEDRHHRRGTRMPVRITDLVVPGTIDEEIRDRVDGKKGLAFEIQDIKDILSSILGDDDKDGE